MKYALGHPASWDPILLAHLIYQGFLLRDLDFPKPSLLLGLGDGLTGWFINRANKPNFDFAAEVSQRLPPGGWGDPVAISGFFDTRLGFDLSRIPFPDSSFASVLLLPLEAQCGSVESAYKEILRVLLPGGEGVLLAHSDQYLRYRALWEFVLKAGSNCFLSGEEHQKLLNAAGAHNVTIRSYLRSETQSVLMALSASLPYSFRRDLCASLQREEDLRHWSDNLSEVLVNLINREIVEDEELDSGSNLLIRFSKPGSLRTGTSPPSITCIECGGPLLDDESHMRCSVCGVAYRKENGIPILISCRNANSRSPFEFNLAEIREAAESIKRSFLGHPVSWDPLKLALAIYYKVIARSVSLSAPSLIVAPGQGLADWLGSSGTLLFDYAIEVEHDRTMVRTGAGRFDIGESFDASQLPFPDSSFASVLLAMGNMGSCSTDVLVSGLIRIMAPGALGVIFIHLDETNSRSCAAFEKRELESYLDSMRRAGAEDIYARPFLSADVQAILNAASLSLPNRLKDTLSSVDSQYDVLRWNNSLSDMLVDQIEREILSNDGPDESFNFFVVFRKPGGLSSSAELPQLVCRTCNSFLELEDGQLGCVSGHSKFPLVDHHIGLLRENRHCMPEGQERRRGAGGSAIEVSCGAPLITRVKVELSDVSKLYKVYESPIDRLKEILARNRRSYHREFWALQDINLQFPEGCTGILGPNGSGKSTLLQLIAGTIQPTTGTISTNGRITAILELGAGFQMENSGRDNALLYGMILGISRHEMESLFPIISDFAELGGFFDQPLSTYSSGMIVRLAFSCAIMVDPDILLIDEALAVGDKHFQRKCYDEVEAIRKRGKTIIFVSHDTNAVKLWCDKAVLLDGGRVVCDGDVNGVIDAYEQLMLIQDHNSSNS